MRASIFRTLWIMLSTALLTGYYCAYSSFLGWRGKLTRDDTDRLTRDWAKKTLRLARVTHKTINESNTQFDEKRPYILMSNHSSLYDIPIIYAGVPGSIRMLAKKELTKIPFFAQSIKYNQHISIDRQNREQAIKDLAEAKEKMLRGLLVWVAPEGTRSRDGKIARFKKGGFVIGIETQALIIPIGIRKARNILPAKTWRFHLNQEVEVHIGSPIDAAEYNSSNKEELIEKTRNAIMRLAGETDTSE